MNPLHTARDRETVASPAPDRARRPSLTPSTAPVVAKRKESKGAWVTAALMLPLVAVNVWGATYYLAAPGGRVRHPLHTLLRPSGLVGQSTGIAAFAIFVFLWLYPLRKKYKRLAFTGSVGKWLDIHVASALLLPLLLATHAAWHSDGVIGLGLVAMLVVIASGVVGRYLYTRIPRAKSGMELSREETASARMDLLQRLSDTTGMTVADLEGMLSTGQDEESRGILPALRRMVLNDFTRRRRCRELRNRWMATRERRAQDSAPAHDERRQTNRGPQRSLTGRALDEAVALADREIALQQQVRMLEATHRVFKFWHVAHRPFAVTALLAVVVHIAVVVSLGATWFW